MGFWDDKVDNPIDSMFDFDRDGELNSTEKPWIGFSKWW